MLENEFHTARLIAGYLQDTLSRSEAAEFSAWLAADPKNHAMVAFFEQDQQLAGELEYYFSAEREDVWGRVQSELKMQATPTKIIKTKFWTSRWIAAASILLVMGTIIILNSIQGPNSKNDQNIYIKNDLPPGGNKAFITLANGKIIQLSSTKNGVIINTSKITYNDGSVVPTGGTGKRSDYATLSTPRGGQYQVTLSDGTIAYLNAESSLRYPITFNGAHRTVTLQGEAYFEVAKDKHHPFIVTTTKQTIQVLGTHFNISSYADETTKTTLVEGSVQVNGSTILKPGEQATGQGLDLKISQADIEEALAWKNGDFVFNNADLESILPKIEKWYNVAFIYEKGTLQNLRIGGKVSRSKNISSVLDALEKTGKVKFKIEGRRITVIE